MTLINSLCRLYNRSLSLVSFFIPSFYYPLAPLDHLYCILVDLSHSCFHSLPATKQVLILGFYALNL